MSMVTSWNLEGVRWRNFSAAEVLWMTHTTTIQHLREHSPRKVRQYLNQVKDYAALREWDNAQMKESADG